MQVWLDRNGDGNYDGAGEKIDLGVANDVADSLRDGIFTNGEVYTTSTAIAHQAGAVRSYGLCGAPHNPYYV